MLFVIICQELWQKKVLGEGDWMVFFAVAHRFDIPMIFGFCTLSGLLGALFFIFYKEEALPFIPILFFSSFLCDLCVHFF